MGKKEEEGTPEKGEEVEERELEGMLLAILRILCVPVTLPAPDRGNPLRQRGSGIRQTLLQVHSGTLKCTESIILHVWRICPSVLYHLFSPSAAAREK